LRTSGIRVRSHLVPDYITGNDHLHAAVQFSTRGGGVIGYRIILAQAARDYAVDRYSGIDQVVSHRRGALLRERLVELFAADAISMAFDFQSKIRIGEHDP